MRFRWLIVAAAPLAAGTLTGAAGAADGRSAAGPGNSLALEASRHGPASPHLLPPLDRLAGALWDDGAVVDTARSRRRALRIALRTHGGQSADAASAMVALARVELLLHRYSNAEPLLIAALPALEARFGTTGAALAEPLAGLARAALAQGDMSAAKSWAARANAIAARYPALVSSEPLRALGAIYAVEERFDDSERVLREALARDQRRGGAGLDTARSLAQLANLLFRAKRFAEAVPLIEQAIAIDQGHLGANHPLIADDFADLGLIYAGAGRDTAAGVALCYALDLLERDASAGAPSPSVAYVKLALAPVLRRLGRDDDANDAFDDAKRILDAAAKDERRRERRI